MMHKNSVGQDCPFAIEASRDGVVKRFRWLPTREMAEQQVETLRAAFPRNEYSIVDERSE